MTDTSLTAPPAGLLQRLDQSLAGCSAATLDFVPTGDPGVIPGLQALIDQYLADGRDLADDTATFEPPAVRPSPPPEVPGYTVEARVGSGGMGEVWQVRDSLDRPFALKVVRQKYTSVAGRERFFAEARAMAQLNHPHVARIHHYSENGGRPYFLMRLYRASLADRLADYSADTRRAVRLIAQVADGVGHLHARGFVHRDLKPSNILLDDSDEPVISDFGLIKGPADGDSSPGNVVASGSADTKISGQPGSHTVAGAVLGTRRYMSPCQAAGLNHRVNPTWDVWALGVMLHELLTGQLPRCSAAPERLLDPAEPDNPPATTLRPELGPRLGRIIAKCLARNPDDRYPNGTALAVDLTAWLNRGRRRRTWGGAVALAAAMIVAAAAIGWARTPPAEPATNAAEVLAHIQKQLAAGQTVEVIGSTGNPMWFDQATSYVGDKLYVSEVDGSFRVTTEEIAFLDLPPTGLDRYRLEAEVRQINNAPNSDFGIYAGRHRQQTTTGAPVDLLATLHFNDWCCGTVRPDLPGGWIQRLRSATYIPGSACQISGRQIASGGYSSKNRPADANWHALAVEVVPDRLTWSFDGHPAGVTVLPPPAADEKIFTGFAGLAGGAGTSFSPHGGYGLAVLEGTAAFRNVRVVPVPNGR